MKTKTNYQLQNVIEASKDQAFVDESGKLTATTGTPGAGQFLSSIIGRASIPDITKDFRASLGIDRIPVQQIILLQYEFGPNGEPVYAALNDTKGLIRFVGSGWQLSMNYQPSGLYLHSDVLNDYVEITFYGTHLNLLVWMGSNASDHRASVDGGVEGTNIYIQSSTILSTRYYNKNNIIVAASGLALGIHTVKIRNNAADIFWVFGFEVLNANASGLININPGTSYYQDKKIINSAADSIAYNTGVTGTKGGRIVRYFTGNDTVTQAFQAVDASAAYLTSADHTNEEVVRVYNVREFGAGRADDFSLGSGSALGARAFTLDDGTTTLVGSNVGIYSEGISVGDALNAFTTLTFVGTGLDLMMGAAVGTPTDTIGVSIDGSSIGNLPTSSNTSRQLKIASGLAYGTHTAKFTRSVYSAGVPTIKQFIIYQPRKPVLPVGAIEVADYNVMGDFVSQLTSGDNTISTGVLRKAISTREAVYVTTWTGPNLLTSCTSGFYTITTNGYFEYTLFGTGFDFRFANAGTACTCTLLIDGVSPTTAGATVDKYSTGVTSFTGSTGVIVESTGASGSGVMVRGLTLGKHVVGVTYTSGGALQPESLDIITPIHSHKSNLYADLQTMLPVGSQGLMDSRTTSPQPSLMAGTKAWAQAIGMAGVGSATTSATTPVPMPSMSVTIKTSGGALYISYTVSVSIDVVGGTGYFFIFVDGMGHQIYKGWRANVAGYSMPTSDQAIIPVSAGVHKVDLFWQLAGTGTAVTASVLRNLSVQEL